MIQNVSWNYRRKKLIRETVEVYRRYKQVVEGISDAEELLSENLDAEMAEMAKEELSDLKKKRSVRRPH